ncbi:OmpA family protein [Granulosicoccus antarcticus]|nr:OmpA family protein [Granulosicoccus antarcticus]
MKNTSLLLTAMFLMTPFIHGCASTEELYAQYDEQACRVALEQAPSGITVVRELSTDETMTWEPVVRFDLEMDVLGRQAKERLDRDVAVLERYPEMRVSVRGFTDASGDKDFNAALASRRVDMVAAYLLSKGVTSARMDKVPLGEGLPLQIAEPEARVPLNRRVELLLLDVNGNPLAYQVGNLNDY